MWNAIWRKLTTTLTGGAIIIALASILSRLLGLVRDRLLASTFGAGDELDIYYAAFKLPDFVFNILVLGALSAAFIPVFIDYLERAKKAGSGIGDAWRLASSLLNILLIGLIILGALIFIFAPQLVPLIAPGFDDAKQAEIVSLTRIMLPAILFFGVSNVLTGILNSFKKYLQFAFAPVLYNAGIIMGIFLFVPRFGLQGLGYGVLLGAALHLLVQVPSIRKIGFRFQWRIGWRHPGLRTIGKLMVPRALGLAVGQFDQIISVIIGSTLVSGSVAVFTLASNLQYFPVSVFGVSLAVASFPFFSEASAQKNVRQFVQHFSVSFRRILFLVIPVSVLIVVLRAHIVRLVLGSGAFDWTDTVLTAQTLGLFAISLFAQAVIPLLARSFYAWQDTATPVKVAVFSLVVNVVGALIFSRSFGVMGLALAFSIASCLQMLLLLAILRIRMGNLDDHVIIGSTLKIVLIAGIAGGMSIAAKYVLALGVNMDTFVGVALQGSIAGLVGVITYGTLALVFRCDEIRILYEWLAAFRQRFSNGRRPAGTL